MDTEVEAQILHRPDVLSLEVGAIRTDVWGLRNEVSEIRLDVSGLRGEMRNGFERLERRIAPLER